MAVAALQAFWGAVDDTALAPETMTAAIQYFGKVHITASAQLVGLLPEGLVGLSDDPLVRGLARRAVTMATVAKQCAPGPSQAPSSSMTDPAMASQLLLAGNETSALAVADSLTGTSATPRDDLKTANLHELNHTCVPDVALFNLPPAEKRVAAQTSRSPFLYADLTCKEVLPAWIASEAVGGKQGTIKAGAVTSTVEALGAGLRAASLSMRFFKSFLSGWQRTRSTERRRFRAKV